MQKNKGLADMQNGEFILNESGTAVSTDAVENGDARGGFTEGDKKDEDGNKEPHKPGTTARAGEDDAA